MFTNFVARLSALRAAIVTVAMVCGVGVSVASAQDAGHVPTLAEFNAVKAQTAMALAQSALKAAQEGKTESSQSNSNSNSPASYQNYTPMNAQPQATVPSSRAKPADPTVEYVHADANGALVAVLSDGTPKRAGQSLGNGVVVQSVTLTDVTVKDSSGVHSLAWGGGAASGGVVESRAMQTPSQAPMPGPGIMTLYPPQH